MKGRKKVNTLDKLSKEQLVESKRRLAKTLSIFSNHVADDDNERWSRIWDMLIRLQELDRRLMYYIGKKKAKDCPAFKPVGHAGYCLCKDREYATVYSCLFKFSCYNCKKTKEEARNESRWKTILGNNAHNKGGW